MFTSVIQEPTAVRWAAGQVLDEATWKAVTGHSPVVQPKAWPVRPGGSTSELMVFRQLEVQTTAGMLHVGEVISGSQVDRVVEASAFADRDEAERALTERFALAGLRLAAGAEHWSDVPGDRLGRQAAAALCRDAYGWWWSLGRQDGVATASVAGQEKFRALGVLIGLFERLAAETEPTEADPVTAVTAAHLRRRAAELRAEVERLRVGAVVRERWPALEEGRRVAELSRTLGVDRAFLYRVRDGQEWAERG